MNSRRIALLSLVIGSLTVGSAVAGPTIGTAKARGDYRSFGAAQQRVARSRPVYRYYESPSYRAPATQAAPAPMVAQASEAGRRYSYAPAAPAATGAPCPQAQASAVDGARRYSYAPSAEPTLEPAVEPAPQTYQARPSYSRGGSRGAAIDRWALPKTDPRKFND